MSKKKLTGIEETDQNGMERVLTSPFQDEQDLEQSLPAHMFRQ